VYYTKIFTTNDKNEREQYIRKFLQVFGTEYARESIDKNIWILINFNIVYTILYNLIRNKGYYSAKYKDDSKYIDSLIIVIDDVRFLNEYIYLKTFYSGIVSDLTFFVCLEPEAETDNKDKHQSELQVDLVKDTIKKDVMDTNEFKFIVKNTYNEDCFDDTISSILNTIKMFNFTENFVDKSTQTKNFNQDEINQGGR